MDAIIRPKSPPPADDRLTETDYPVKRGLSLDTLRKHGAYYDPDWKHPKATAGVPGTPRLIIPVQGGNLLARDTRAVIPPEQEQYVKSKVKVNPDAGWTFNSEVLSTTKKGIIIAVEGEIDAMSIEEAGGTAVGLGSINFANDFLDQLKVTPPYVPIVVAYDNEADPEKAERINKAAAKLAEDIRGLGFAATAIDPKLLVGNCKDANEALVKDREALRKAVGRLTEQYSRPLTEEEQEILENSAYSALRSIVHNIKHGVKPTCLTTGFPVLDRQLGGGLFPGMYVFGANSSMGKTTLVMQIADHVVRIGTDVLVFSLEMTREELTAKTLSRMTAVSAMVQGLVPREMASTAREIMDGYDFNSFVEKKRELIREAVRDYVPYSKKTIIYQCGRSFSAKDIYDKVEWYIKATGRKPLVIVDYMQILKSLSERMTDKQAADATVKELCNLRRDFSLPVIAISSFSRSGYEEPAKMSSYKESGGIEYSADYLIALQLEGVGTSGFDASASKKAVPRKLELVILKQRMGEVGEPIKLSYYSAYNLFIGDM
ncbi:replicative DNA helicase [Ruminococcaceae bacterium FB2012]|nr:replicative DNA helicase [Ruminococcaceae bacterium FB2012]